MDSVPTSTTAAPKKKGRVATILTVLALIVVCLGAIGRFTSSSASSAISTAITTVAGQPELDSASRQRLVSCALDEPVEVCAKLPVMKYAISLLPPDVNGSLLEKMVVDQKGDSFGEWLMFTGAEPHAAPWSGAAILIDAHDGTSIVAVHSQTTVTVYFHYTDKYLNRKDHSLPHFLEQWIDARSRGIGKPIEVIKKI